MQKFVASWYPVFGGVLVVVAALAGYFDWGIASWLRLLFFVVGVVASARFVVRWYLRRGAQPQL